MILGRGAILESRNWFLGDLLHVAADNLREGIGALKKVWHHGPG